MKLLTVSSRYQYKKALWSEMFHHSGTDEGFPGLVPLIKQYLDSADVDVDTRCTVSQYLNFISVSLGLCIF